LDFDGFKEVNDRYGHDMGDVLLVEIGKRMSSIVAGKGLVARLGGDEFGIVYETVCGTGEACDLAQGLIEFISTPLHIGGCSLVIGCSIGIAIFPDHSSSQDELLTHADLAMYRAKSQGRRTFCMFERTMTDELRLRRDTEDAIRHALDHDGIEVHFQPEFCAQGVEITGFEALARLRRKDGSLIAPDQFIAISEDLGLVERLGKIVLEKAACHALT